MTGGGLYILVCVSYIHLASTSHAIKNPVFCWLALLCPFVFIITIILLGVILSGVTSGGMALSAWVIDPFLGSLFVMLIFLTGSLHRVEFLHFTVSDYPSLLQIQPDETESRS